jgi:hypothetical protein
VTDNPEPLPRPQWIARRVVDIQASGGGIAQWVFTLVVWAAALGLATLLWMDPTSRSGGPVATLVMFCAGGLIFLYAAINDTRRRARFPSSVFELDSSTFTVGGCVSGILVAPPGAATAEAFNVVLNCFEIHALSGSSRQQSLWRGEVSVPADGLKRRDGCVLVPVAMMTPATARPTCDEVGQRIEWRLAVTARPPGLNYSAGFELPVFPVKDGVRGPSQMFPPDRPVATPDDPLLRLPRPLSLTPAQLAQRDRKQPAGSRIRLETGPDGVVLHYPNPSGLVPWVVGALLLVAGGAMIDHPFGGFAASAFVLAILLVGVLDHPRRLELRGDAVILSRGVFGLRWHRRIAREDVSAVTHKIRWGPYHSVVMEVRGGSRYTVGAEDQVPDSVEAEWLKAEIETALGLGSDAEGTH